MKKLLLIILFLSISFIAFSQSVRITAIVEGDCPTGDTAPRVIELFVSGTVDVTNLKIQFQFSSATNWVVNNNIGVGNYTNSFLYVVNDITAFDNNFPGIRTATNTTTGTIISNVEGGEKIRLVDSSNNNQVIDIYGIDGQNGENTSWNFSNSYVKRNNNIGPNTTFDELEWTILPKNTLLNKGICWNELALNTIVDLQAYTLSTENYNLLKSQIKIYPNPSSLYIELSGLLKEEKYHIYSILGNEVSKGSITNFEKVNIQNLNVGIYFIKLENGFTQKFIKK